MERNTLFDPYELKGFKLKNRIVLPPMVRFSLIKTDGLVTEELIKWYEDIAKNGVGLIIVEASCVSPDGKLRDNQLGVWDDSFIPGLKKIAQIGVDYNVPMILQLHHAGFKEKIAEVPEEVLDKILDDFVTATYRGKKCGFQGIELHGAHTYLISQLHSRLWNTRKDKYGDRLYFTKVLLSRIQDLNTNDFIIGIRMGGNEPLLEDGIFIAKELDKLNLDYIHVSSGVPSPKYKQEVKIDIPEEFPLDWVIYLGVEIKKHISTPVIGVRGIKKEKDASYLIENNLLDLVAVGRALIARPNWVSWAKKKYNYRISVGKNLKIC